MHPSSPQKRLTARRALRRAGLFALIATLSSGCAAAPPATRVRARDLGTHPVGEVKLPIVVEFEEGDVIPVHFVVSGQLAATPPDSPPLKVVAKRHFFLRIDKDGIRTSLDGEHFGKPATPGSFRLGLGIDKAGVKGNVEVVTPTHEP